MEKWNALAQKFFRMHEEDLRPMFHRRWGGTSGRFQREIKKLEQSYTSRKCASKNLVPRRSTFKFNESNRTVDEEKKNSSEDRERRSSGQLRVAHNPGHRMIHIVRNIEKWTEEYLTGCKNQNKIVHRWQRFVNRWRDEIQKNPTFLKEFEEEEKYLRNNDGPGKPCGRIYIEFGLHGQYMELRDASADASYEVNNLGDTDFGNDHLMSMVPFQGEPKYMILLMIRMAPSGCQGQDPKITRNIKHPTFIRLYILSNSII